MIVDFLIIGGGISGLFMAYLLQKNNYSCKILERDNGIDSRKQGFSLTMQGQTEDIFRENGLLEEMYEYGCVTNTKVFCNTDGKILHESNMRNFNYPLPRQKIRHMFYSKLSKNTVEWNKLVINIDHYVDMVMVQCSDGSKHRGSYLLVCDGIHSSCRKCLLPKLKLNEFGLINIYGLFNLNSLSHTDADFFRGRTIQILDGHHRLFSKPFDNQMQMWELTYYPNEYNKIILSPIEALNNALGVTSQWSNTAPFNAITVTNIDDIIVHPLYDLEPQLSLIDSIPKNIVFFGDSIHPMAPFIGMGANEAIADCNDFLKELLLNNTNIRLAISNYHEKMIIRTKKSVAKSRENVNFYHSVDATCIDKLSVFKQW